MRIEDTDQIREVEGSVQNIIDSLRYLGLDWQEGAEVGGNYGPYTQSERLHIYREWAQKLADKGLAYADLHSKEELESLRDQAKSNKQPFLFRNFRPDNPPVWDGTQPLRLKSTPQTYTWHDEVMGELSAGEEAIDDFILIKADGYPTYNFAHIIDDHLMNISHVIRSQEFISSIPRYLNLYQALEITPPIMATVPNVLGAEGNKKLSKRDGAKQILEYQKEGYPPEALMNFIATLGWNDGTEQEVFTPEELIQKFSLDRVQKSGARFDDQRLLWISGSHIRSTSLDNLFIKVEDYWPESAAEYDDTYKRSVLELVQERLKFYAELPGLTQFFFEDLPINSTLIADHKQLKKLDQSELLSLLDKAQDALQTSKWDPVSLQETLNHLLESTSQKPAVLFSLIRIAVTQSPASPSLADTLALLGQESSLRRIKQQLDAFA